MKKTIAFILALLMILSITAYAADEDPVPEPGAHWEEVSSGVVVWKSSTGNRRVHVWIELKNTGDVPLYLKSTSVDLENGEGDLCQTLGSVTGFPQVLLPGETGVYDEVTLADDELPDDGMTIYCRPKIEEAKVPCVRYDVTGFKVSTDSKFKWTKGKGRIENNTGELADGIIAAAALCYDGDGNYLGILRTYVTDDIPDGERQGFETMQADWPVTADDIASTVVYCYPQQFQF